MRVFLAAISMVLVGCGSTPPVRATKSRRVDGPHPFEAWKSEKERRQGAAAEEVTTYLARHPRRPADVRDGLLAARLVQGMTLDEVALVLSGRDLAARAALTVQEIALIAELGAQPSNVSFVEVRMWRMFEARKPVHHLEATLVLHGNTLVSWSGTGDGGANLTTDMLSYRGP